MSSQSELNTYPQPYVLYYCNFIQSDATVYQTDCSDVCTLFYDEFNDITISDWLIIAYGAPSIVTLLTYTLTDVLEFYDNFYTTPQTIFASQPYGLTATKLADVRADNNMLGYVVYDDTNDVMKTWSGSAWLTETQRLLSLAGGTMAGDIDCDGNDINNVGNITMDGSGQLDANQSNITDVKTMETKHLQLTFNASPDTPPTNSLNVYSDVDGIHYKIADATAYDVLTNITGQMLHDQSTILAPMGQRDNWTLASAGSAGPYVEYDSVRNIVFSFSSLAGFSQSADGGITWTTPTFDIAPATVQVVYFNSTVIVSVGNGGGFETYRSTDNGVNYTKGAAHPGTNISAFNMVWFNNLFITGVTNTSNKIMTSPTGVTWTLQSAAIEVLSLATNGSICVTVGSVTPFSMWSEDGTTWTNTSTAIASARSIVWSNDRKEFVATGISNRIVYRSRDGKTWTSTTLLIPTATNNTMRWVSELGRYYYAALDTDSNYSLYSSPSPLELFQGTHLDGAVNKGSVYGLVWINSLQRFVMGFNAADYIGYSTASTKIKALSDHVTARGAPVTVSKFSASSDVTLDNTITETTISAPATSLGSLAFQDSQPLGMGMHSRLVLSVTSTAGDTLTIRYKINGTTRHTVVITVPAGAAALIVFLDLLATVRSATLEFNSCLMVSGVAAVNANGNGAYTRTVINTLSITAQWGANVNQLRVSHQSLQVDFINGQP